MARLEERLDAHGPALRVHETRLSEHERHIEDIQQSQREMSQQILALSNQVGRLANIATTQGLSLERIERHTKRVLEILEPRTVIVVDE